GDRIRQARERAGLRQQDLADLIGMSTRQVQNYEAGESKQYAKLRSIAGATGVTVEWLLGTATEAAGAQETAAVDLVEMKAAVARIEQLVRELLGPSRDGAGSA